jgi:DNA-directed RNA polymerase subunit RPC12/RpoP
MALLAMKLKCVKCGYEIPVTSQEYKQASDVKCPRCTSICKIVHDEEEAFIEECAEEE